VIVVFSFYVGCLLYVLFCVLCFVDRCVILCDCVITVLCLNVVPLALGENPYAVNINNNNNKYRRHKLLDLTLVRIAGLKYKIGTRSFPKYEGSVVAIKQPAMVDMFTRPLHEKHPLPFTQLRCATCLN
jgi:hypothetical protein